MNIRLMMQSVVLCGVLSGGMACGMDKEVGNMTSDESTIPVYSVAYSNEYGEFVVMQPKRGSLESTQESGRKSWEDLNVMVHRSPGLQEVFQHNENMRGKTVVILEVNQDGFINAQNPKVIFFSSNLVDSTWQRFLKEGQQDSSSGQQYVFEIVKPMYTNDTIKWLDRTPLWKKLSFAGLAGFIIFWLYSNDVKLIPWKL